MKKSNFFIVVLVGFLLIFRSTPGYAQPVELTLIGEGNGDVIKLGWLPKAWPAGMTGVKIQRRVAAGNWELLTTDEVYPGSGLDKSLENVEPSPKERRRLRLKMSDLIAQGSLQPQTRQVYRQEILADPGNLPMLAFVFSTDYDIMLLNGFGFIDRGVPSGQNLEYGIFPVIEATMSEVPAATFKWVSGTKPDNTLAMQGEIEIVGNKKDLLLKWEYSRRYFKENQLKGFNIYQVQGNDKKKLNDSPVIVMSRDDPATLTRRVAFPDTDEKITFMAVPVSYFETEAEPAVIEFDPALYAVDIVAPKLSARSEKAQVLLSWALADGSRKAVTGFKLMRKAEGEEYVKIAELRSAVSTYRDNGAELGRYYFYRIVAVPVGGGADVWSNEVVLQHMDNGIPGQPTNLQGQMVQENGASLVRLTWDYPQESRPVTFRIFIDSPFGDLAHDTSIAPITTTGYDYELKKSRSGIYHFAVQAMTEARLKSVLSNQIEVVSPSTSLPPISIWPIEQIGNDIVIYWDYSNDIADLAGFRVYNNGVLTADENTVTQNNRSYRVRDLDAGDYRLSIEAVTRFGLVSKRSSERKMIVE
jgi:hypothetical protein